MESAQALSVESPLGQSIFVTRILPPVLKNCVSLCILTSVHFLTFSWHHASFLFLKKIKPNKPTKSPTQTTEKALAFSAHSITLILEPSMLSSNIFILFLLDHEMSSRNK